VIAATDPRALDEPCLDEVGDDPLGGTLGDAHALRDVAEADAFITGDAEQNLSVVRDESPGLGVTGT
jgi:hypothetical protein